MIWVMGASRSVDGMPRAPLPSPEDAARIQRTLGWRPTSFRPAAPGRGSTGTAARWIAADDVRSAFVKIGATRLTAGWIRDEARNYGSLSGWFLPQVLGFDDDGERPVLALEDLSGMAWPPPWSGGRVGAVVEALAAIHRTPPPAHLGPVGVEPGTGWSVVALDPRPFLGLGLCSPAWLDAALPTLLETSAAARLGGDSLVHLDVRSDNICFRAGSAVVLDWNAAAVGNHDVDTAFWLPSLHAEGGPAPEAVLPDAPELASFVAGFFRGRAGCAPIPEAPYVRPLQLLQARTALPWAIRAAGLRSPA
jgi:Phosphotransferase enzyme family